MQCNEFYDFLLCSHSRYRLIGLWSGESKAFKVITPFLEWKPSENHKVLQELLSSHQSWQCCCRGDRGQHQHIPIHSPARQAPPQWVIAIINSYHLYVFWVLWKQCLISLNCELTYFHPVVALKQVTVSFISMGDGVSNLFLSWNCCHWVHGHLLWVLMKYRATCYAECLVFNRLADWWEYRCHNPD